MNSYNTKPPQVLPVTLKMLKNLEIQEDQYSIYSKPVETVEIVARLVKENETAMRTELIVQDFSGSCTLLFYKKQDEDESRCLKGFAFTANKYVRVIASLRKVQGEVNIIGQYIERVNSRKEVNEFYSQLILATLNYTHKREGMYSTIIQTIRTLNPANILKGVNITDIHKNLLNKSTLAQIEENCAKMVSENLLEMGIDWNHYRIIN